MCRPEYQCGTAFCPSCNSIEDYTCLTLKPQKDGKANFIVWCACGAVLVTNDNELTSEKEVYNFTKKDK